MAGKNVEAHICTRCGHQFKKEEAGSWTSLITTVDDVRMSGEKRELIEGGICVGCYLEVITAVTAQ